VTDVAAIAAGSVQKVVDRIAGYNFADAKVRFEFDLSNENGLTESKARALSLLREAGIAVSDEFRRRLFGDGKERVN
jgi:hypothetical protein